MFMVRKAVIENTELTLKILRHFARDGVPYPSNLNPRDLHAVFRDQKPADIDYSVICAIEVGLLNGKIQDVSTMAGREIMISFMDGLSQRGGEYVRHSASHYERAIGKIREAGIEVTTEILSACVKQMGLKTLNLA